MKYLALITLAIIIPVVIHRKRKQKYPKKILGV